MKSFRQYINPVAWLADLGVDCSHITYDPTLTPRSCEYRIRRGSTHDGTLAFTLDLIKEALRPIALKSSFYQTTEPADWSAIADVRYTVGPLRLAAVFGDVDLPVGRYPGQRERVSLPVRCEYVTATPPSLS